MEKMMQEPLSSQIFLFQIVFLVHSSNLESQDIVPLPQLPMSLLPGATFVTVEAVNVSGGGFFQASLGILSQVSGPIFHFPKNKWNHEKANLSSN